MTLLTACNEDALVEQTEQTDYYGTYSFNDNNSGKTHGMGFDPLDKLRIIFEGDGYYSPWDIWYRQNQYGNLQPNYIIRNTYSGNEKENLVSPYTIIVTPFVGLAYYDGLNNGIYEDVATANPTVQYNLASGNYPNLYANNQEVGNLVQASSIIIQSGDAFRIEDVDKHLLLPSGNDKFPQFSGGWNFQFNGLTLQEEQLLAHYGKVFFYEVQVTDANTGALIAHDFMHIRNDGIPSNLGIMPANKWLPVLDSSNNPLMGQSPIGSFDMYYLKDPNINGTQWTSFYNLGNICDSREVIFDVPNPVNRLALYGTDEIRLGITGSANFGWLNASYYLGLY